MGFNKLKHISNIKFIFETFLMSQSDIFGGDVNEKHPLNIKLISITFPVSHFDILGSNTNEQHSLNI